MTNRARVQSLMIEVHRILGLALAFFLVVIAATGSIIAYYDDIERVLNPRMRVVTPRPEGWTMAGALAIRDRLEREDPRAHVFSLQFPQQPDEPLFSRVMPAIDRATGQPAAIDYDEVFADPYTGERLGQRIIGAPTLRPEGIASFLYYLHYALIFPLGIGIVLIGTAGLVWATISATGLYLTLPAAPARGRKPSRPFARRWATSWKVAPGTNGNRRMLDLHRATGLWLWPLLMVFAITGYALNQGGAFAGFVDRFADYAHYQERPPVPPLAQPLLDPPVGWDEAVALGERHFAREAQAQGFSLGQPAAIEYRRDLGVYFFLMHTSRDLRDAQGTPTETDSPATAATMAIDARDGRMLGLQLPTGQRAGNTVVNWLIALHVTAIGGRAWQIAVSLFGLAVVFIASTGVLLWWRRRKGRQPRQIATGARAATSARAATARTIKNDPPEFDNQHLKGKTS